MKDANPNHHVTLGVETEAGHGLGKPTSKVIEEQADMFAFLADKLTIEEVEES